MFASKKLATNLRRGIRSSRLKLVAKLLCKVNRRIASKKNYPIIQAKQLTQC